MAAHRQYPRIELQAGGANFVYVLGQNLLTPSMRDHEQEADQRNGRRDHYAMFNSEIEKRRIAFQGRTEERLQRKKCDDELGRTTKALPICFFSQRLYMRSNLTGMIAETSRALSVVLALNGPEISLQRNLCIYDDLAVVRQGKNQGGPLTSFAPTSF